MKAFISITASLVLSCLQAIGHLAGQPLPGLSMDDLAKRLHYYEVDVLPENIDLGVAGRENVWNFNSLLSPRSYVYELVHSDRMASLEAPPAAGHCIIDPWGNRHFMIFDNGNAELVGRHLSIGEAPFLLFKRYRDRLLLRRMNLAFNESRQATARWTIELNSSQVAALALPYKGSLTVEGTDSIQEIKDASGLMYLPESYHNANRLFIEHTSIISRVLDHSGKAMVGYTELIHALQRHFEKRTRTYSFVDATNLSLLALAEVDDEGSLKAIWFKSTEDEKKPVFKKGMARQFALYPSTSDGNVRMDFSNFSIGKYQLTIYNIIGKPIWRQDYDVSRNMTMVEDFSFLPKGTYIYSLADSQNNKLFTRRFVIINP